MSNYSYLRDDRGWVKWTIIVPLILAAVAALTTWVMGYWQDSWHVFTKWFSQKVWVGGLFPNGFNLFKAAPFFWLLVVVALIVGVVVLIVSYDWRYASNKIKAAIIALAVLASIAVIPFVGGLANNDKDAARSYARATVFVVEDTNDVPSSLDPLVEGARRNVNGCAYVGRHDVPSCIVQGTLPTSWERRSASATGAALVMSRTSSGVQNTELLTDTLTYLYNEDGSGAWTAIRNGINRQPVHSIVSWDGKRNPPQSCRFTGEHSLNMAFGGKWEQNLLDEIAHQYPALLFEGSDMWGYCNGEQPQIVIPAMKLQSYNVRTTLRPAGVLVVTGSATGQPVIQHIASAKPGDFPGPVYAIGLVERQRAAIEWLSGRRDRNHLKFGFEVTDVETQAGNSSEYLLKSEEDGRLYWVTPLKPRSTDSQTLVAYSVTPADRVNSGVLNTQRIFVLGEEDPRIINLDDMEARSNEAIRWVDPGFFTGSKPGSIVEFLPVSDDTWQAFGELQGRPIYVVSVPANTAIPPTVYRLNEDNEPQEVVSGGEAAGDSTSCGEPGTLSDQQLADCMAELAAELQRRTTS